MQVEGHELTVLSAGNWETATRARALLVEDNHLNAQALESLLEQKKYRPRARFWADTLYVASNVRAHSTSLDEGSNKAEPTWCPPPSAERDDGYSRHSLGIRLVKLREPLLTCPTAFVLAQRQNTTSTAVPRKSQAPRM